MFKEFQSVISNLVEQHVIQIFQESEDKLIENQDITLDEKTNLVFELRAVRDNKIIEQKKHAEQYVRNVQFVYQYNQDYDKRQELINERIQKDNELLLQIEKDKELIKQEIISQEKIIPQWIKNNAQWWSEDQIDDETFVGGIQFLMKEKIVNIPDLPEQASEKVRPSFVDESKDPQSYIDRYNNEENYKEWFDKNYPNYTIEEAVGVTAPIPGWFKNNAKWWSQGLITEDEFIKGIEFLVEKRILKVN